MPRLAAPFCVRSFRFQWSADLLTSWAFEMETVILGWYVLIATGSVLFLTIFAALQYVGTLLAPFIGVAGDRVGHRNLLIAARALYAAVAAALMLLAFCAALTPILVCALAALSGLARPSDLGLRGALIAETVPHELLTGAAGISRTTTDSARVAGALVGAGLFATVGIGAAYVVVTSFYALGALLILRVEHGPRADRVAATERAGRASAWSDLREGIVHIWDSPRLLAVVWIAFLFNLAAFPMTQGLLPYVAREIYRVDETGLGYLVASFAFGALLGSLALSRFGMVEHLARSMIGAAVVWFTLLLVFAQMRDLYGGIASLLLTGFAQSIAMVSHTVILLREAAPRIRGRVMGVRMLAIYSLPLGILAAGVLIGRIGFRATASIYAAVGLAMVLLTAWHWRGVLLHRRADRA